MDRYLWVALGSALGGMARYWLTQMGTIWWGAFPWGTLLINLLGSAVIGWVYGLDGTLSSTARLFLMTGICGGFTTFSAFSLQTMLLLKSGAVMDALGYVAMSVVICVVGCGLGLTAAK